MSPLSVALQAVLQGLGRRAAWLRCTHNDFVGVHLGLYAEQSSFMANRLTLVYDVVGSRFKPDLCNGACSLKCFRRIMGI